MLVAAGYYSDVSLGSNYYRLTGGNWSALTTCEDPIVYQTYSTKVWFNENDPVSIDAACTGAGTSVQSTIWFRADQNAEFSGTDLDTASNLEKLT